VRGEHCRRPLRCNLNLKALWNVGKWRAPVLPGQRVFVLRFRRLPWAPNVCGPVAAALGVPVCLAARRPRRGPASLGDPPGVRNRIKASKAVLLREVEVARRQLRGRYSGQRDGIGRVVGYDRVYSDLLGIGHRRRIIRNALLILRLIAELRPQPPPAPA
jgi:hypothetical protein